MKIYFLDRNEAMISAWKNWFGDTVNIEKTEFEDFMNLHSEVDIIVSPANSFGLMDGGYDLAITEYFGEELMHCVQEKIIKEWYGEQPVATSISVKIPNSDKWLIHTPTMRTPEIIKDERIIYQCTRTTLIEANKLGLDSIVIPAFGGGVGNVEPDIIAKYMYIAYEQVKNVPAEIDWDYASRMEEILD